MTNEPFENWWWLENGALLAHIFETMDGIMNCGDEFVPALALYEVQVMFETLVRRCPEMEIAEISEFRHVLKTALAGNVEHCGHA